MCAYVCQGVCSCVFHVYAGALSGQGKTPNQLELESEAIVSCPAWALGTA